MFSNLIVFPLVFVVRSKYAYLQSVSWLGRSRGQEIKSEGMFGIVCFNEIDDSNLIDNSFYPNPPISVNNGKFHLSSTNIYMSVSIQSTFTKKNNKFLSALQSSGRCGFRYSDALKRVVFYGFRKGFRKKGVIDLTLGW